MKVVTLTFIIVSFASSQTAVAGTQNSNEKKNNSIENLVTETIRSTEKSLSLVDNDTSTAIQYIDEALVSVKAIKESISKDTHVEEKSQLVRKDGKEYWFSYPAVDKSILKNSADFPILNSKYETEILYKGKTEIKHQNDSYAYFDYPFAYASLKTAKDALNANEIVRAKIALEWVFEAVYITPDFLISLHDRGLQDNKLHIDSFINIKGDYPVYTESREVSQISG